MEMVVLEIVELLGLHRNGIVNQSEILLNPANLLFCRVKIMIHFANKFRSQLKMQDKQLKQLLML